MSNENLEFQLSLDASQVQQGATRANQAIAGTTQAVDKAYAATAKLQQGYDQMARGAQDTAGKIIVTQQQYDRIVMKLQEYQRALEKAKRQEDIVRSAWKEEVAAAEATYTSKAKLAEINSKYSQQLDKAIDAQIRFGEASEETAIKLDGVAVAQKDIVDSSKGIAHAQEEVAESTEKVSRHLTNLSFAAAAGAADLAGASGLANALRTTGQAVNAFALATGPQGMMLAGITAGISLISLLAQTVKTAGDQVKKQVEEVRRAAEDARALQADAASASANIDIMKDFNATLEEQRAAREALAQLLPQMVVGYDEENQAILANNASMREEIELMRERERLARLDVATTARSTLSTQEKDYAAKIKDLIFAQENLQSLKNQLEDMLAGADREDPQFARFFAAQEDAIRQAEDSIKRLDMDLADLLDTTKTTFTGISAEFEGLSSLEVAAINEEALRQLEDYEEKLISLDEALARGAITEEEYADALAANKLAAGDAIRAFASDSDLLAAAVDKIKTSTEGFGAVSLTLADQLKLASEAADAGRITYYANALRTAEKGSKEYADAVAVIAKALGVTEEAVMANTGAFADMAESMQDGKVEALNLAIAANDAAIATKLAAAEMVGIGSAAYDELMQAAAGLETVNAVLRSILSEMGGEIPTPKPSRGGGGSSRAAWEDELDMMKQVKSEMESLGSSYITVLERMLADHRLSAEGRKQVEKELEMANRMTSIGMQEAYIEYLEGILASQKMNAQQRLSVEKQLLQAQKDLYSQQIAELDKLGNAVIAALRNKYQAEREASNAASESAMTSARESAQAQIAQINKARDAQIEAINAQIRAIDDLIKARKRQAQEDSDEERLRKLQVALEFEKDAYNQRQLQEQIVQLEKDISTRKEDERLQDEKQALQDQIAEIRKSAADQIAQLNELVAAEEASYAQRKEMDDKFWEERLSDQVLQGEALVFLQNATQEEIIALLEDYYPEYFRSGQEMGRMLYDGITPEMMAVVDAAASMAQSAVESAQRVIDAWAAAKAAMGGASMPSGGSRGGGVTPFAAANTFASPISPAQAFVQDVITFPDRLDEAINNTLYAIAEPRINYYDTRAQEAFNAGYSSFARADVNRMTAPLGTAPQGAQGATGRGRAVSIENIIVQSPSATAYEMARETRLQLQRMQDMDLI